MSFIVKNDLFYPNKGFVLHTPTGQLITYIRWLRSLNFWKQNDRWLTKNPNQKQGFFFTACSTHFYFPTRWWAENPHWISFVLWYCYYHSLISKRICVVDPLSGAFNVSWLTWIYQRWNVIVVMMLAAKQPSLAWVKGNTCLGRKHIGEHWFSFWGHRFSFWNLIP